MSDIGSREYGIIASRRSLSSCQRNSDVSEAHLLGPYVPVHVSSRPMWLFPGNRQGLVACMNESQKEAAPVDFPMTARRTARTSAGDRQLMPTGLRRGRPVLVCICVVSIEFQDTSPWSFFHLWGWKEYELSMCRMASRVRTCLDRGEKSPQNVMVNYFLICTHGRHA